MRPYIVRTLVELESEIHVDAESEQDALQVAVGRIENEDFGFIESVRIADTYATEVGSEYEGEDGA